MVILETYTYIGPNRRSQQTVIERVLRFEEDELTALSSIDASAFDELDDILRAAGSCDAAPFSVADPTLHPLGLFALRYGHYCIELQRWAGHRVSEIDWLPELEENTCRVIFEYEHWDVGERAGELALGLLQIVIPALSIEVDDVAVVDTTVEALQSFLSFAESLLLPRDAQAIIDAAARAGVPCMKLDRFPFEPAVGDFRVRRNGCLLLGQGVHQKILDGMFAVGVGGLDASGLKDRRRALKILAKLRLPQPANSADMDPQASGSRIKRTARRIGYPLELSPLSRGSAFGIPLTVNEESALEAALDRICESGALPFMQARSDGSLYKLVVANRALVLVVKCGASAKETEKLDTLVHPELQSMVERVAEAIDVPVLALTLRSGDITLCPDQANSVFTDIDLAPELDEFLPEHADLLRVPADGVVRWLFPGGELGRIPVIAVTGTNGKTTTTIMVHRILQTAGHRPGMATTEGLFDERGVSFSKGDFAGSMGAKILFKHNSIDIAVLETARGGVASRGFAFEYCDVAICLNVSGDHLNSRGIRTLEQLAALKRTVLERARTAVVINADEPLCVAMLPLPEASRCCLVSLERTIGELELLPVAGDCFAVLEKNASGEECAVIYDNGKRLPLFSVSDIPAVMNGTARFNLSNALHAAAACYLAGVAQVPIQQALSAFEMSYENVPGRINFYRELPFDVLIDYMHNPDGVRRLTEMVDALPVQGRKIITLTAAAYNPEEMVRDSALEALGYYDIYICCNYYRDYCEGDEHVAGQLARALLESGVDEDRVFIAAHDAEALDMALQMASTGDLIVAHASKEKREKMWQRLAQWR